jgi:hypothetical protein
VIGQEVKDGPSSFFTLDHEGSRDPKKYKWVKKSTRPPTYMSDTTIHGLPEIVSNPSNRGASNVQLRDLASK